MIFFRFSQKNIIFSIILHGKLNLVIKCKPASSTSEEQEVIQDTMATNYRLFLLQLVAIVRCECGIQDTEQAMHCAR